MSIRSFVEMVANIFGQTKRLYMDRTMDAGFVGQFDFKSDYVRNGSLAAPATKALRNMVQLGANATVDTTFPDGFGSKGLSNSTGAGKLRLPDAFKLPTNETHFGFCVWSDYNLPFGALPAGATISIGGYAHEISTFCQYALYMFINGSGAIAALRGNVGGSSVDFPASVWPKMTDGARHQWAFEFEVINSGTQKRMTAYCDGVQVAQVVSAYSGSIPNPQGAPTPAAAGPFLGQLSGYAANGFKGYYGRTWLKRFSLDPENVTMAAIVAKEWALYGATPRFA